MATRKATTLSDFLYEGVGMVVRFDFDEFRRYFTTISILYVLLKKTPEHYVSMETFSRSVQKITGITRPYSLISLEQMRSETLFDEFKRNLNKYGLITVGQYRSLKKIQFNGAEGEAQMKRRFDWVMSLDESHLKTYEFLGRAKTKNLFNIVQAWHNEHEEKQDWKTHIKALLKSGGRVIYV
jgi:hypothetical protein